MLALDAGAAADLPGEIQRIDEVSPSSSGSVDAIVGYVTPDPALNNLETFYRQLRPGGRLILAAPADSKTLLEALQQAGYIHCLVETQPNGITLYRGECPPTSRALQDLAASAEDRAWEAPFFFIPVIQTPNKPAWRLGPEEKIEWQAPTILDPASGAANLLVFSALTRVVAFMQRAVLVNILQGINKVGKFPSAQVKSWPTPFLLNPAFHAIRNAALGPSLALDPQVAIRGDE